MPSTVAPLMALGEESRRGRSARDQGIIHSSSHSARKQTILGKACARRCRFQSSGMKTSRTRESPSPGPAFASRLLTSIVVRVQLRALVLQDEGGVLRGGDGEEGAGRRSE